MAGVDVQSGRGGGRWEEEDNADSSSDQAIWAVDLLKKSEFYHLSIGSGRWWWWWGGCFDGF